MLDIVIVFQFAAHFGLGYVHVLGGCIEHCIRWYPLLMPIVGIFAF
jgi:hypothetical protein